MVNLKSSAISLGILWGALFFCPYTLSAQDKPVPSVTTSKPDTAGLKQIIRQRKHLAMDSSMKNLKDTTLVINDSILIQNDSSLAQRDTVLIKKDTSIVLNDISTKPKRDYKEHSPPRATILSAVVPGLGQAYNRKYWKIPIIYAAGGSLYWYFDYANQRFNYWKKVYEMEFAKGPEGNEGIMSNAINNRDTWSKRRGYTVIFLGLLYVANVVDAMVDAYFLQFDVSDDLSLRIEPNLDAIPSQYAFDGISCGVKLCFNF